MIRIEDSVLRFNNLGVLNPLLCDKTTKENIIWATAEHAEMGEGFCEKDFITPQHITGEYSGLIKTRARRAQAQQSDRTKKHGEVFTPVWMCKMMNDFADEDWFGEKGAFDSKTELVTFPTGKTWQNYVDSRRLEICCGEAPFLVSRYDSSTGEEMEIKNRIGILDRKLRVVNENTDNEEEWLKWAFRALQATYGYEFQGDNLLIARINVVETFCEYLKWRWFREPTKKELEQAVNVAVWNLWQMDGLTGTVPLYEEENLNFTFDDFLGTGTKNQPPSRVYDWRSGKSVEFKSIKAKKGQEK